MDEDPQLHAEEAGVDLAAPEVGLAELVHADRVLGLSEAELPLVAEMLGLHPAPPAAAAAEPRRRAEPAQPEAGRTREPPVGRTQVTPDIKPEERVLAVRITERTAEPAPAPIEARPLDEVLMPAPGPPPRRQWLFAGSTRRALLRGVTAVRAPEGELDVPAAVEILAAGRAVEALPYEWIETTHGEVQLLLDIGPSMDPYREDVDRLPEELVRIVGDDALELRWFEDCPLGPGGVLAPEQLEPTAFVFPKSRTRLLAVTAFGARGPFPPAPSIVRAWRRLAARCRRNGVPLLVLTPIAPPRRPAALAGRIATVTWDHTTGVRDVARAVAAAKAA
jgi:hypothetical protein